MSNSITLDNASNASAIIMDVDGSGVVDACIRLQTIPNSIVHDNVSAVSAITMDFDGPGVHHAYFGKRFQIGSSMISYEYAPIQL